MKKILIALLMIGVYLNRTYAYFYDFLDQHYLSSPVFETPASFSNLPTIKYLAMGDSLTTGVGVSDYKNSYPYLIAQKLSSKNNIELINLARAGDTSSDVLIYQIPKVFSQKPDLITLLIGVNDIHNLVSSKKFEDNLTHTVAVLRQTHAKIYLLSIPYLGSGKIVYFPYNFILDFRTKQFNNIIRQTARNFGVEFIDLYSLNKSGNFYSQDQFHPGASGYQEWSKAINVN